MAESKSSISEAKSYQEIGEFWDEHDLDESWEKTTEAEFEVDLKSDVFYYAVEKEIASKLHIIAEKHGVTTETLVNLWLKEKINQETIEI